MVNSILSFIVALGVLVFLHEYGHYAVARLCKVTVIQFSVGFGRPIFQWKNKKSGVLWTIGWMPLGGFVRMLDERDESTIIGSPDLKNAFNRQHVSKRIAIVLAGPVANLLVAWVLYSFLAISQTSQVAAIVADPMPNTAAQSLGLQANDRILAINREPIADWSAVNWSLLGTRLFGDDLSVSVDRQGQTISLGPIPFEQIKIEFSADLPRQLGFLPFEKRVLVGHVQESSPGDKAGIKQGDQLLALNEVPIISSTQFTNLIRTQGNKPAVLTINRDQAELQVAVTPELVESSNGQSIGRLGIGVGGERIIEAVNYGLLTSIRHGADRMFEVSVLSISALGSMLTGDMSWKHLSGPVSIASAAGDSSSLGILPFLSFLAMLSVSLGILNLLPIPVLDGGHLLYYFAEIVIRRPVSEEWIIRGQKLGLLLIGLLTCVAFFNDIQRLL